jgi:adenylate cyclase
VRVPRTFAFVDLSGFTRFTDLHGDDEAVAVLTQFRYAVRSIASDVGVRIAKWLGDGAMLVAVEGPALVRAVVELEKIFNDDGLLPVRAGLAWGEVILFEGDDYTGGAVNLASRLCDLAQPFEVLATAEVARALPDGVVAFPVGPKQVPGFGAPVSVCRLTYVHAADSPADPAADAAADPAGDALASDA